MQGDLCDFLKGKKSLSTSLAVRHALDIARLVNVLVLVASWFVKRSLVTILV